MDAINGRIHVSKTYVDINGRIYVPKNLHTTLMTNAINGKYVDINGLIYVPKTYVHH